MIKFINIQETFSSIKVISHKIYIQKTAKTLNPTVPPTALKVYERKIGIILLKYK